MSILLDPEGTVASSASFESLRQQLSAPSCLLRVALIFLERRSAQHVHRIVERVAACQTPPRSSPSAEQIAARARHLAVATARKVVTPQQVHPFFSGLISADAVLQLSVDNNVQASVARQLTTILISWQERRLRAEIPTATAMSYSDALLLKSLMRMYFDTPSRSRSSADLGTTPEEREEVVRMLEKIFARVDRVAHIKRTVKRVVLGAALAVLVFIAARYFWKLKQCQKIIDERQQAASDANLRDAVCLICLDGADSGDNNGELLLMMPCRHPFHRNCIQTWILSNHGSCPTCRGADPELSLALQQQSAVDGSGFAMVKAFLSHLLRVVFGTPEARTVAIHVLSTLLPVMLRIAMTSWAFRSELVSTPLARLFSRPSVLELSF